MLPDPCGRVGADLVHADNAEGEPLDRIALARLRLLGAPAEQDDLLGREQRGACPDVDELGCRAVLAEHVRHPHPVERPGADAGGDVQVGMGIEIDEAYALIALDVPSDGSNPDRAVAAKDERGLVHGDSLGDAASGVPDDLDDLGEVLRPRVLAVGSPAPGVAIAMVAYVEPCRVERLDQAGRAQGSGCLLLPRGERARARRDADHPKSAVHDLTPN